MNNKIIGLAGTNGSGKDSIGEILAKHHNYLFISVTDLLRDELKNRNLPVDREHMRGLSSEWRRNSGLGVLVEKAMEKYQSVAEQYTGLVMASLRNPGESELLHKLGGTLAWVDADPNLRYNRVQANAANRGRAGEDQKTYEEFLAEEAAEMHPPSNGDATNLNMAVVREQADITIYNEGDDLSALKVQIQDLFNL